jgi:hypothetical protein
MQFRIILFRLEAKSVALLFLMGIAFLGVSHSSQADCLSDGGREKSGQCYCLRYPESPLLFSRYSDLPTRLMKNIPSFTVKGEGRCPRVWGLEFYFPSRIQKWMGLISEKCEERRKHSDSTQECEVLLGEDSGGLVRYQDGFAYGVKSEKKGVNVIISPISRQNWDRSSERVDQDIFQLAQTTGSDLTQNQNLVHFHLDLISHFKGSPHLFLDFLTDYLSHQKLVACAFNPKFFLSPTVKKKMLDLFPQLQSMTGIQEIAAFIQERIPHDFPIHLKSVMEYDTLQLELSSPALDWKRFGLATKLFETWIAYLEKNPGRKLQLKTRETSCLMAWTSFISQIGLSPEEYRGFIDQG